MFPLLRHADDKRHVQAGFVDVTLASRKHASVVAEVEDEGVFQQAVFFQSGHGVANDFIDHRHAVVVPSVCVAKRRRVRKVLGQFDRRWIGRRFLVLNHLPAEMQRAFMRLTVRFHVEEWLTWSLAFSPGR